MNGSKVTVNGVRLAFDVHGAGAVTVVYDRRKVEDEKLAKQNTLKVAD